MRILFLDRSTKLDSVHDLKTRARGGMISSLFTLSDALAQMGHSVSVCATIGQDGTTGAGVKWSDNYGLFMLDQWDVLVCNRGVADGYPEIQARSRVLWTHDLPHNGFIPRPKIMNAFAATVFMSGYAERIWRDFYRDIGKSFFIPNGVDLDLFQPRIKDYDYLIYASAPNRGLRRLPLIYEAIKSRLPGRKIYMRAFSNMGTMHPNEVDDREDDGFQYAYKTCEEAGIDLQDPLPQREFARELGKAGLMILPTDYPEICSNTILQSLASGTPIVTTGRLGSAGEWIDHGRNGWLTKYHPVDYMIYQMELVRGAVSILEDQRRHAKMANNAAETRNLWTWEKVATAWDRMLRKIGR